MAVQRTLDDDVSLEDCNAMKASILAAILDAVGIVSPGCTNFLLSPTFLECYAADVHSDDGDDGDDEDDEDDDDSDEVSSYATASLTLDCAISATQSANQWYGRLMVGFDGPSAVLDFAATSIDPSALSDIWGDDGVFSAIVIEGTKVKLTADDSQGRFLSLKNQVHLHFSSHHSYSRLETLGGPNGLPYCRILE